MANYVLNRAIETFRDAFGYNPYAGNLGIDAYTASKQTAQGTDLYKYDEYGNRMFAPVTLAFDDEKFTLPFSSVSVAGSKKVVNTDLVNRRGSVNEQISINDYEFRINGVVISRTEHFPEMWIEKLNMLFETKSPIEIINPVTDYYMRENQNIIILTHNLPDMRGVSNAQAYSFKAKTDTNLELIIED